METYADTHFWYKYLISLMFNNEESVHYLLSITPIGNVELRLTKVLILKNKKKEVLGNYYFPKKLYTFIIFDSVTVFPA